MHIANGRKPIARFVGVALAGAALVVFAAGTAEAQQTNVGAPFNSVGHSFYENIGVNWGARGPGWFFNFGGGGAAPPFGGFDPNGGANFGFGFGNGNVGGGFNFTAGQGANSTFVSQTPSVTIPNGGNGMFIDGTFRPFVTSVTPVVGMTDNSDPSPLRERLRRLKAGEVQVQSPGDEPKSEPAVGGGGGGGARGSSAERGAPSVAALKAQAAAAQQSEDTELAALLEKAKGAEAAGKPSVARIYYQMAARRATGDQQREILTHLQSLPR